MHLNHSETNQLLPGPWKSCLLPNRFPVSKRLGTAALREVSLGLLLWLVSRSVIASLTGSQILNPHANCPWRSFRETIFSLSSLLLPVFCLENSHALSQVFRSLLPCCFMAHSQPLPQQPPDSPPPTHPHWPTLTTPERLSFLSQHLGDSGVLLLSKTQVQQCCPPASLSVAEGLGTLAPGQ